MAGCSPAPPRAAPDPPVGGRPDPAIADLSPVPVPRPLVGARVGPGDLPVVAVVSGPEAIIAVHLAAGRCAVAVASTLADSGGEARFSFRVDAPEEGRPAVSGGGRLPDAAAGALGPTNTASGRLSGGDLVLYCGGHGAALWLEGVADPVKVTGAGRARRATIEGDPGHLVVVAPPATLDAALPP